MPFLRYLLALLLAAATWAVGLRLSPVFPLWIDPLLVLVIYTGLRSAPAWGMVGGSVAGLVADALSGGTYGLYGFADTLVAFVAERLQRRLVAQDSLRLGLIFALAAALQQVTVASLHYLVVPATVLPTPWMVLGKVVSTAVLGTLSIAVASRTARAWRRWRKARSQRLAIDTR